MKIKTIKDEKEEQFTSSLLRVKPLEEEMERKQIRPLTSDAATQRGEQTKETGTQQGAETLDVGT